MEIIDSRKQTYFVRLNKLIENLLQIFREKDLCKRPNLDWNTNLFKDLEMDSLEFMEFISAIEKEFEISIDIADVSTLTTLGELVDYLCKKVKIN